jgi:dienelactone hydrolase
MEFTETFVNQKPSQAILLDVDLNERVVMVPAIFGSKTVELETTIFKPPGEGPFPIVVMNHGKDRGDPRKQNRDRFLVLSREFVVRGYAVVIPMRKGFSHSTGEYVEHDCDMTTNGQIQADDLQSTLDYLHTQAWADANRVVIAGQSYGGLTAMAFGMRHYPGVKGLINFAGGLRLYGGSCHWQQSLVGAFANYGAGTTLPSIWFYGENDSHFEPKLAASLHNAYVQAGGHARLIVYGAFENDAHMMSSSDDGVKIWWPETENFLRELGMPTEPMLALHNEVKLPQTQQATIEVVTPVSSPQSDTNASSATVGR